MKSNFNISQKRWTGAAPGLAIIICFSTMLRTAAAESVKLVDYLAPNGEGSTWVYTRSGKGDGEQKAATRITVVEDHYPFELDNGTGGSPFTSQKLEESGSWENGRFIRFKGKKRDAFYTYTGTGDSYRFYGTDVPVPGSPDRTKNRLQFSKGYRVGPMVKIGKKYRNRSSVYRSNKLLGYTFLTLEPLEIGTVKVPAGTFRDCIRLRFTLGSGPDSEVGEEWWAKGVGLVKWRGISGELAGISEVLVSTDLREVIPYSPPGLGLSGQHLYEIRRNRYYGIRFPPLFLAGTLLEETVVLKNTGSEALKGVTAKLINNPHFTMDPFEKRDLDGGESVALTVRMIIPEGPFEAITHLEIKCDDRTVEPITVDMSLSHFLGQPFKSSRRRGIDPTP